MFRSLSLSALVLVFLFLQGCQPPQDPVARGKYLVTVLDCSTCHTPKMFDENGPVIDEDGVLRHDQSRFLGGHPANDPYPTWSFEDAARNSFGVTNANLTAWAGPWGVSFTQNLTPDKETGLGEWTEEAFIQAIRSGKHQGQANGRAILPPMPWDAYRHLTDEDMKAVWAYLQTIPAVSNQVPTPVPPPLPPGGGN